MTGGRAVMRTNRPLSFRTADSASRAPHTERMGQRVRIMNLRKFRRTFTCAARIAAAAALSMSIAGSAGALPYTFEILAQQDTPIGGNAFALINQVALNNSGDAVFVSQGLSGSGRGIFTPTQRLVGIGDTVGGQQLNSFFNVDINNNGQVVFTAGGPTIANNGQGVFTPTMKIAVPGDTINGHTLSQIVSNANINDSGKITFMGRDPQSGIYTPTDLIVEAPSGAVALMFGGKNTLNNAGDIAFEGRTQPNSPAIFKNGATVAVAGTGDNGTVVDGVKWIGGGVGGAEATLSDSGDVAWLGTGSVNGQVIGETLFSTNGFVVRNGQDLGGLIARDFQDIEINASNQIAYRVTDNTVGGGDGVFVDNTLVARNGDTILGKLVGPMGLGIDINDGGQVLFSAQLDGVTSLILATPDAGNEAENFAAQLLTGSPASLSQTIDVGSDPVTLTFDYLFETTTGQLDIFLGTALLDSIAAPSILDGAFVEIELLIDGIHLNQTDVDLAFVLDGPTGSSVIIDNVNLPNIINGDFQDGTLDPWVTTSSGQGAVNLITVTAVPEPGALALLLLAAGLLFMARRRGAFQSAPV